MQFSDVNMGSPVDVQLGQKNSILRAKCLAANKHNILVSKRTPKRTNYIHEP